MSFLRMRFLFGTEAMHPSSTEQSQLQQEPQRCHSSSHIVLRSLCLWKTTSCSFCTRELSFRYSFLTPGQHTSPISDGHRGTHTLFCMEKLTHRGAWKNSLTDVQEELTHRCFVLVPIINFQQSQCFLFQSQMSLFLTLLKATLLFSAQPSDLLVVSPWNPSRVGTAFCLIHGLDF